MDTTELKRQLLGLLNRRPWVPIRVDATDGQHTVIETPLRVTWDGNALVVSRHDAPMAIIPAEGVTRLVPIDELPGENGGLSHREFTERYRKLRWAEPFVPYDVELRDGTRYVVTRPDQLLAGRRQTASFFRGPGKGYATIRLADVVAVRPAAVGVA